MSWPGGYKHALSQPEHEAWNRSNYPGTRQLCVMCQEPTGRCREDQMSDVDGNPLCEDCWKETYCSLCVADKIPNWPGESKYVHATCEASECERAHSKLSE